MVTYAIRGTTIVYNLGALVHTRRPVAVRVYFVGGGGGGGGDLGVVEHRNKYSSEWKHSAQKWCNGWPLPASIGC